jgi:hypothetical protein
MGFSPWGSTINGEKSMKRTGLFILIGLIFYCALSLGQEIYQWVDEKGTINYTNDLSLIPEKYRDQVQKRKYPKEPFLPTVKKQETASEPRDLLGRGEEWWGAKAKEWHEKFFHAKKNYETAHAAWRAKEKELDESKFKPDSLKRKLKTEMKALEERANEWKKQMELAKNMLEKVLPKQAEEYRADPNWVKIAE